MLSCLLFQTQICENQNDYKANYYKMHNFANRRDCLRILKMMNKKYCYLKLLNFYSLLKEK